MRAKASVRERPVIRAILVPEQAGYLDMRIEFQNLQPLKVPLVVGDEHASVGFGHRSDDHVERAAWSPRRFAFRISRAHIRAALSSKGRMRPANRAGGPSGPANHASSASRVFPFGCSRTARRISAMVSEAIKRSASARAHPGQQRRRGLRLDDTTDDVAADEIARHRTTLDEAPKHLRINSNKPRPSLRGAAPGSKSPGGRSNPCRDRALRLEWLGLRLAMTAGNLAHLFFC